MENLKNDRSYECTLAKLATATNSHTQYHICIYTHHICIHTRRLQHLLIRNPIKHRNPTKQTIRQLRQSRRRIALSSPSSIQLGPLRPQNLLTHPPSVSFDYSTPTPTQTRERERERERERHTQNDKKAPNPNTMLITSCVYRSRFCDGSYGFLCLSFPPDATVSAAVAADCVRDMVSSVTTAFLFFQCPSILIDS